MKKVFDIDDNQGFAYCSNCNKLYIFDENDLNPQKVMTIWTSNGMFVDALSCDYCGRIIYQGPIKKQACEFDF